MGAWCKTRAIVALAAAYAVAAEATLLAIGGPIVGVTGSPAFSLCSPTNSGAAHPAPGGKEHDRPAACAACCCGAPVAPPSAATMAAAYEALSAGSIAAVVASAPTWRFNLDRAHRSRAPPLG
ncbi:MAG: hypothetical protein WB760_31690 [Xanthobacteraceae bacterium]